jgi:hypothetical protein
MACIKKDWRFIYHLDSFSLTMWRKGRKLAGKGGRRKGKRLVQSGKVKGMGK